MIISSDMIKLFFIGDRFYSLKSNINNCKQEYIPVGCVPTAAVAILRGVCLPEAGLLTCLLSIPLPLYHIPPIYHTPPQTPVKTLPSPILRMWSMKIIVDLIKYQSQMKCQGITKKYFLALFGKLFTLAQFKYTSKLAVTLSKLPIYLFCISHFFRNS